MCLAVAHHRTQEAFAVGAFLLDEEQGFQYVVYRLASDLDLYPHELAIFCELGARSYLDSDYLCFLFLSRHHVSGQQESRHERCHCQQHGEAFH